MAKKKSPNADLISALKGKKPLPYDPELMQAIQDAPDPLWDHLESLRRSVYRRVSSTIWAGLTNAMQDPEALRQIEMAADNQWENATGLPALTSLSNLEIVVAAVAGDGFPATDAGIHAWAIAKTASARQPCKSTGQASQEEIPEFVPNIMQKKILQLLDGKAMKKQQLADEICAGEGSRLYNSDTRTGDLNELMDLGLVQNKAGLGYYRPAAPPN